MLRERTSRQIQAAKLMLPKTPDKASRIEGVRDKAIKAMGMAEGMYAGAADCLAEDL